MIGLDLALGRIAGPILLLLSVLSLVSVTLILFKAISLASAGAGRARRAAALEQLQAGDMAGAAQKLAPPRAEADRVLLFGIDRLERGALAGLEQALMVEGNTAAAGFFRHLRTLDMIATISPLLGLLGTVLGMIQAFRDLELAEGAANAALLAGGIWQALLTTAAGLIVALPAAAGSALLSARAEAATGEVERAIGTLLAAAQGKAAAARGG